MQFVVRNSSLAGIVLGVIGALASSSAYSAQEGSANVRVLDTQIGDSTFYGSWFEGRKTASGRIFHGSQAIAAHRTYPFGTLVPRDKSSKQAFSHRCDRGSRALW